MGVKRPWKLSQFRPRIGTKIRLKLGNDAPKKILFNSIRNFGFQNGPILESENVCAQLNASPVANKRSQSGQRPISRKVIYVVRTIDDYTLFATHFSPVKTAGKFL